MENHQNWDQYIPFLLVYSSVCLWCLVALSFAASIKCFTSTWNGNLDYLRWIRSEIWNLPGTSQEINGVHRHKEWCGGHSSELHHFIPHYGSFEKNVLGEYSNLMGEDDVLCSVRSFPIPLSSRLLEAWKHPLLTKTGFHSYYNQ